MGVPHSKATVKNINNTLVVNKNDIDLLNEQNTTMIANTIIENAKTSTASIVQTQNLSFTNLHAKGDIVISDVTQKQQASITFKNLNVNQTTNDISNSLLTSMVEKISASTEDNILSQMMANASSAVKSGALSIPSFSKSESNASNTNNTTVTNTTDYTLKNIISNTIQNNFTSKNVENCISSVTGNQNILVSDIVSSDGSIKITSFSQDQAATLMTECISQSGVANSITSSLQNIFGITIVDDKKTSTDTKQSGESQSTTETKGLFDIFSGLFSGVSSIFVVVGVASSILCCLLFLFVLLLLFFTFNHG